MDIDVNRRHEQYIRMSYYWQMMDDVTSSQKVIQDAGTTYLPSLSGMDDDQYTAYAQRGTFPMLTKHTLNNFVGMSMRKDVMTANVPQNLLDNVNGKGMPLTDYVKNLVRAYLKMGRCGTLTEYSAGRSKLLLYGATDILDWKTRIIDDVEMLSFVALRESVDNPYEVGEMYQYRFLMLDEDNKYTQEVYDSESNLIKKFDPTKKHQRLEFIPFVIHGGWDVEYPPLLQIAEQNIAYYKLDADYKHGLHFVALPTPYTVGIDDPKNRPRTLGSSKIWHLPEGAKAGMLEFTGAGLGEFTKAKEEIMDNVVTLSSRILAPPMNMNETATAAAIRNAGDTASLAEIVGMLSRELTTALVYAIDWSLDIKNDVWVKINNDFIPTILSGSDVASYVASYLKGGMSFYTLFQVLKRGEIQEGNRQLEDELNDIRDEILQRQVDEVALAEKLSKIQVKLDTRNDPNYMPEGPAGEQSNEGITFKEN